MELRTAFSRNESQLFAGTRGERSSELRDAGRAPASYDGDAARSTLLVGRSVGEVLRLTAAAEADVRTYRSSESMDAHSPGASGG